MEFVARLAGKIGNNLVHSNVIKEEDAEIYIYGINQILVSVLNVSSALIIGLILGVLPEIAVFMAAYIPLRSFAGGYHAKNPLRCYIFSVIMLIVVSIGMNYLLYMEDWVYYVVLATSVSVMFILAPVEDRNKPLDETEHKVYKRRTTLIAVIELIIALLLKLLISDSLFVAIVYSFVVLSLMLIAGKVKNRFDVSK